MSNRVSVAPEADDGGAETDPFYILTPSSLAEEHELVLKQDDTFAVFDRFGDFRAAGRAKDGLYHHGTRYLSRLALRIGRHRPLLLSSAAREDNSLLAVDLTNVDVVQDDVVIVPRGTLHISRAMLLHDGALHERLTIRNYGLATVATTVSLTFDADYADLFEVRGTRRNRRGERLAPAVESDAALLGYLGLDGQTRRTRVSLQPAPETLSATEARFEIRLAPQEEHSYLLVVACESESRRPTVSFSSALTQTASTLANRRAEHCEIVTSNQYVNNWIRRSVSDLAMMMTDTPSGPYPYAGVPWFSTPFGRDGIITALESLWTAPHLARGVLGYLASTQATEYDPDRDAQPGKILHEARAGEMAALREIPFGRYYGTHDATPLFVMLAAAYYQRTGDQAFIAKLWPCIVAAVDWIERDGDLDADGFIEYARQSPEGLVHQGWKDSHDSVFHADGRLADGPVALCELQGYVYAAWRGAALIAGLLDEPARAAAWSANADALFTRFDDRFWNPALGTYSLALDGEKQPCAVRTSNAGHVLFSGLARPDRAPLVASVLTSELGFSGWGIRTVAAGEARYNPMSYHNGSVWPHDNAIIAAGFARYGLQDAALAVLSALFDASLFIPLHRLPELFCGFPRKVDEGPTMYPVACSPQAWAAGSVFLLLQSALGLEIQAPERIVRFTRAKLPPFLDEVRINRMRVGGVSLDLLLERHEHDVGITVLRRTGDVQIVAVK